MRYSTNSSQDAGYIQSTDRSTTPNPTNYPLNVEGSTVSLNTASSGAATSRLFINSSGNIGLGTSTPARVLEVKRTGGDSYIRISGDVAQQQALEFYDTDSRWIIYKAASSTDLSFYNPQNLNTLLTLKNDNTALFKGNILVDADNTRSVATSTNALSAVHSHTGSFKNITVHSATGGDIATSAKPFDNAYVNNLRVMKGTSGVGSISVKIATIPTNVNTETWIGFSSDGTDANDKARIKCLQNNGDTAFGFHCGSDLGEKMRLTGTALSIRDCVPNAHNTYDLGSSTSWFWRNIYG
jgi:hypothetical protein